VIGVLRIGAGARPLSVGGLQSVYHRARWRGMAVCANRAGIDNGSQMQELRKTQ